LKKAIAILLVPILVSVAIYTFALWANTAISDSANGVAAFKNINSIFFDEFFTVLIIVDVLLLLASFFYSDKFHKIIRNSGFVISTILIKISFSTEGIVNNALIVGAVLFGFLILLIHNKFESNTA
jgi:NADH:ubiquinone oxidoreductase subunit 6 (subunit J)